MSRAAVYPTSNAGEDLTMFSLMPLSSSRHLATSHRLLLPMQPPLALPPCTRTGHAAGPPCLGLSGRGPRAPLCKPAAPVLFGWAATGFGPLALNLFAISK
jgi:hypothetical protein